MRLLLDANVLLDCLVMESSGMPRPGKAASEAILNDCDAGKHQGLIAWHTLPIISYYHGKKYPGAVTGQMMDQLLTFLEVPIVGQAQAVKWRTYGIADFEDALQVACAITGKADLIITRNGRDFANSVIPAMTPEKFLATF